MLYSLYTTVSNKEDMAKMCNKVGFDDMISEVIFACFFIYHKYWFIQWFFFILKCISRTANWLVSKMTCIWSLIYQYTYVWISAFTYHTCMYVRWKSFREICFSLIDFVVFKVSSNSIKTYMHIFNVFLIKCLPVDISRMPAFLI